MSSNKVFISFIVPCYNVEKYLTKCLDSLQCQKDVDAGSIEYILVNDGSTDNTLLLLNEFATKDKRAVVVSQTNKGVSAARNNGLRHASGEYVFFLDSDDYLAPDASQVIYSACANNDIDILITNAYLVKEDDNKMSEWNVCSNFSSGVYNRHDFIKKSNPLPISFKTYRKELLQRNNISYDEDLKLGEVYTFFLHALAFSERIAIADAKLMYYLVRTGSVMRTYNLEKDYTIINTIHKIDEYSKLYLPSIQIQTTNAYNLAYFRIVNLFTFDKYAVCYDYSKDIGLFINKVIHERPYRNSLIRVAFSSKTIFISRFKCILQLILPVRLSYFIFRKFALRKNTHK